MKSVTKMLKLESKKPVFANLMHTMISKQEQWRS